MKKVISTMLIIFALVLVPSAYAAEESSVNPGITPDSPFYFLDTLGEYLGSLFAFTAEAKVERSLQHAQEKLAEAEVMAEKGDTKAAEKARVRYQEKIKLAMKRAEEAQEKGKTEALERVQEATQKHQTTLQGVMEKVPEEAKESIQKAIESSSNGYTQATSALEKAGEAQKKTITPGSQTPATQAPNGPGSQRTTNPVGR